MFKASDLITKVRELAAEFPDNVYQRPEGRHYCSNTEGKCTNGTKDCIIGQALMLLDMWDKIPSQVTGDFQCDKENAGIGTILRHNKLFECTQQQIEWLVLVQNNQDWIHTWGKCVEAADRGEDLGPRGN